MHSQPRQALRTQPDHRVPADDGRDHLCRDLHSRLRHLLRQPPLQLVVGGGGGDHSVGVGAVARLQRRKPISSLCGRRKCLLHEAAAQDPRTWSLIFDGDGPTQGHSMVAMDRPVAYLGSEATAEEASSPPPHRYPSNCSDGLEAQEKFDVEVTDRDPVAGGGPLIGRSHRAFNFSFTTAWFPGEVAGTRTDGLIVRVVECNPNHHSCAGVAHPEWTNAGALTVVRANLSATAPPTAADVSEASVFWAGTAPPPRSASAEWGAADPRCAYRAEDQTYYLTCKPAAIWVACFQECQQYRCAGQGTTAPRTVTPTGPRC